MTMFYVMRPHCNESPDPVFSRFGGMTQYLEVAVARARGCNGRAYGTDGAGNTLVHDAWVEPVPKKEEKVPYREFVRRRTEAALFGITV